MDPASDPVVRLDDRHVVAGRREHGGSRGTCSARSDDRDAIARQRGGVGLVRSPLTGRDGARHGAGRIVGGGLAGEEEPAVDGLAQGDPLIRGDDPVARKL